MEGRLTFLGTGTSMGVPTVGCECAVCTSADPHDKRLRPSVMLRWNEPGSAREGGFDQERVVVIDTGPDFREQALRNGLNRVDAVFYTHGHADHMLGMDDLRPLSFSLFREGGPIPLFASTETAEILERVYDYTFSPSSTYPNRARVALRPLAERNSVYGVEFIRVPVRHGEEEIAGFRIGSVAYLTDVSGIPEESFALLEGLDCLVLSALRYKPHPSHATVEQAVSWARRIGARQTWFTHIAHDLGHEATNRILPAGIRLAHDGLSFAVNLDRITAGPVTPGSVSKGSVISTGATSDLSLPMGFESGSGDRLIPVFRSIEEIPAEFGPSVAAIGNFDGVHLGHREILTSVVAEARALGVRAIAVTFDPHPEQFLRPDRAPKLLTPIEERTRLMAATGLDAVLVLRFDAVLARLTAKEFVSRILVGALGIRGLHEGGNFHFGHGARAGVAALERFGADLGFAVHVHSPVKVRGIEVSSSAVRERIAAGDLTRARWMLGRPFSVLGRQARGRGIGGRLLVPTVNLDAQEGILPPFGVYVTRLKLGGLQSSRLFEAVTNLGNRPTFGEPSFAIESHILNLEPGDLDELGRLEERTPIELEFLLRLRGEIQWPSAEALKAQIFKDMARANRYFRHLKR